MIVVSSIHIHLDGSGRQTIGLAVFDSQSGLVPWQGVAGQVVGVLSHDAEAGCL
jgi:hypothetical protein